MKTSNIWSSSFSLKEKINLSLADFEKEDSILRQSDFWLYLKTNGNYIGEEINVVLNWYQNNLSSEIDEELKSSIKYSLYFDILEEPKLNEYAWGYFLSNNPNNTFLKILLQNSGPVPFNLKKELLLRLIKLSEFQQHIYQSIRHSLFDLCGDINFDEAQKIFSMIDLNEVPETVKYSKKYRTINDLKKGLKNKNY